VPTNGHSDACHIDMSRSKYQFSPTSLTMMNVQEAIRKGTSETQSNCPSNSVPSMNKDSENHHVHFSNAGAVPEKEDIISLYGTPKEEMIPGGNSDGYNAENEDNFSYKGNTLPYNIHCCCTNNRYKYTSCRVNGETIRKYLRILCFLYDSV